MSRPKNAALNKTIIAFRTFPWRHVTVLSCVDSTNEWLKANGVYHGQAVIAREQTAGKGTKGRGFFSPDGTGLYLSVMLKDIPDDKREILTCLAAVAVAESIEIICGQEVKIKWVNDLLFDEKKVCGILCEQCRAADGADCVIVGIGVNVFEPKDGFGELSDTAGALLNKGGGFVFNSLSAEIINRLRLLLDAPAEQIMDLYRQKSAVTGKEITVTAPDGSYRATAVEIADNGQLKVKRPDGTELLLLSADVSIAL